jgi:hypothetical protein
MPWSTIIIGIIVWTVGAFVITLLIRFVLGLIPRSHMEQMMEEDEADFVSFQIKKRELDSMLENLQTAREEMEFISRKIDEAIGDDYEDFDER